MAASSSVNKIFRLARRAGRFFLPPQSGLLAGIIGLSLRCGRPSHLHIGAARFFCAPQDCFPTQAQTCSPRATGAFPICTWWELAFYCATRRFYSAPLHFQSPSKQRARIRLSPCSYSFPAKRRDRHKFPLIHAFFTRQEVLSPYSLTNAIFLLYSIIVYTQ